MTEEKFMMFRNRLLKVFRHLSKQARKQGVSCYRVYDHDLPEFPLSLEIYGEYLYLAEYKRNHGMTEHEHDGWMEKTIEIVHEILGIKKENIFIKLRQRKAGRLGQYQKVGEQQHEFVAEENGLKFLINLSDYLDTGLFLDHRVTRSLVKEQSNGKKVLNLFAYTGSFSVYAAAGGASEVVTIDLSNTYTSWAEKNFLLNGFTNPERFLFHRADVLAYLKNIPAGYFDIVILDPPTFSNSKKMDSFLDIQRDHADLINSCLAGIRPGGLLYFSTNARQFVLDVQRISAKSVKDITRATTPFDFEGRLYRWCYCFTK